MNRKKMNVWTRGIYYKQGLRLEKYTSRKLVSPEESMISFCTILMWDKSYRIVIKNGGKEGTLFILKISLLSGKKKMNFLYKY